MQCPYLLRDKVDAFEHCIEGAAQVERDNVQSLARISDSVRRRIRLALRVNQQSARQIERGGVGEQLVQVGVGDTLDSHALVLRIAYERTSLTVPPSEIRFQLDAAGARPSESVDFL